MNLKDCYNFDDFRKLAQKNLPAPIFHYIDGGADDETTLKSCLKNIYTKPGSFVKAEDRIYPDYNKNDRLSVILFKTSKTSLR